MGKTQRLACSVETASNRVQTRAANPISPLDPIKLVSMPNNIPLPLEIINHIADFLFEFSPPVDEVSSICCTKSRWSDIQGFMCASYDLHRMGFRRWITILTIKTPEDWHIAETHTNWIREIHCADGVLVSPRHRTVLSHFEHLYAVSIDAHSDVYCNPQMQFAYRDLFRALPSSLRHLQIIRAHGPDARVIATVKEWCPNLEGLRLGRCTAFNCSPPCQFWQSFPFEHDSYMSDQDPDAYARSLAMELVPLKFLKTLRMGLYLIPSTTVLAHRLFHRRNLPAPAHLDWHQAIPQPQNAPQRGHVDQLVSLLHQPDPESEFGPRAICTMCIEAVGQIGKAAEENATAIIQELVPSLEKVQWMSWLSAGHLGLNTYTRLVTR